MSNNTTADVTGIFSLDTNRLVGLAAKGSPDVTYLACQDTPTSGIPLTATLSDGVNDFGAIRLPGQHTPRLHGVTIFGPEGAQPAPTVVPQADVTISASGFVGIDGENWYQVTATNSSGSNSSFEMRWTGLPAFTAKSGTIEFKADDPSQCSTGCSLYIGRNSYAQYALNGASWSRIYTTVATDIHRGRMSIGMKPESWSKTGFTGPVEEQVFTDAKVNVSLAAGGTITFALRSVRLNVGRKKARIAIVADDGYLNFFRVGVPILQSYGIKSSAALIPATWGQGSGISQVATLPVFKEYVRNGNQCIAHGPNKPPHVNLWSPQYPDTASRLQDIKEVIQILLDNGLTDSWGAQCYIFPQGVYNSGAGEPDLLLAMQNAGIRMSRGAQVDNDIVKSRPTYLDGLSALNHKRMIMPIIGHQFKGPAGSAAADDPTESANIAAIVDAIQNLSAAGADMTLMLHRVVHPGTVTAGPGGLDIETTRLAAICAAIKAEIDAGRLEDVLFSDFVRLPGQ